MLAIPQNVSNDPSATGLPPAMTLPPLPQSPEDEKPRKSSIRDHADLPKDDIDNFELDLQENDTDSFEREDDPMPPSFQDTTVTFTVDSVQNTQLDESQDDDRGTIANEEFYDDIRTNEELYGNIPAAQFVPKADQYEHPHPLSQPLIISQKDTYGEDSETTGEILHSSQHQQPLPLPNVTVPPSVSVTQQPILSDYTPLLTLTMSDSGIYENSSSLLSKIRARQYAQKKAPPLKLIPPVHSLTTRSPPPQIASLPQRSNQPTVQDPDSIADDPYLAFTMDLESLDISKLTLEQLEQIDPRQAQIWMLLKMHQMIRKVEDVYESTEQLYSIRQAPPPIPKKPNMQLEDNREDKQFGTQHYENMCILQRVKRPIPTPRRNIARNRSEQGNPSTIQELYTSTSEEMQQESELVKVKPKKMFRQQKVIGKHLNTIMSVLK